MIMEVETGEAFGYPLTLKCIAGTGSCPVFIYIYICSYYTYIIYTLKPANPMSKNKTVCRMPILET